MRVAGLNNVLVYDHLKINLNLIGNIVIINILHLRIKAQKF